MNYRKALRKYDPNTPFGQAMISLYDPKHSWNRFPTKQLNFASRVFRWAGIDFYHLVRSIRRVLTGTYSNKIPYDPRWSWKFVLIKNKIPTNNFDR